MKKYRVRFYRRRENPDDEESFFEHDIFGNDDREMMLKMNNIIKNHESMGGTLHKVKVVSVEELDRRC